MQVKDLTKQKHVFVSMLFRQPAAPEDLETFLVCWHALAASRMNERAAGVKKRTNFKHRPKHHYLFHTLLRLKDKKRRFVLNPKIAGCFGGESFVGVIGRISKKTHRRTMPLATLTRWRIGLQLKLGCQN